MKEYSRTYIASSPNTLISQLADGFAVRKRLEIFYKHFSCFDLTALQKGNCLDIGATSDCILKSSNIWHKLVPSNILIDVLSDQRAVNLHAHDRVRNWYVGSAIQLPFSDESYEIVISNATLEHVGSKDNQIRMLREVFRVSSKYVLVSTPDRKHPIEFHSRLPFIHMLPRSIWRKLLKYLGMNFLASEDNLNLLSRSDIRDLLEQISPKDWKIDISYVRLLGFKSHVVIVGKKI